MGLRAGAGGSVWHLDGEKASGMWKSTAGDILAGSGLPQHPSDGGNARVRLELEKSAKNNRKTMK